MNAQPFEVSKRIVWRCLRCGHRWMSRLSRGTPPDKCPRCKDGYWMRPYVRGGPYKQKGAARKRRHWEGRD